MHRRIVIGLGLLAYAIATGAFVACGAFGTDSPSAPADSGTTDVDDESRDGSAPSDTGAADGSALIGTMINIDGLFRIDATEVTRGQYTEFLKAKSGNMAGQPAACDTNQSYVPAFGWAGGESEKKNMPVLGVDWCDAYMFCAWAGKRLCGHVGDGGPLGADLNTANDEWHHACSHGPDGLHEYPYGNAHEAGACNDGVLADGGVSFDPAAPVGSFPRCEGGYPGLFDMSGNAAEWVNCASDAGNCTLRGAGSGGSSATCKHAASFPRASVAGSQGIRCCAPP